MRICVHRRGPRRGCSRVGSNFGSRPLGRSRQPARAQPHGLPALVPPQSVPVIRRGGGRVRIEYMYICVCVYICICIDIDIDAYIDIDIDIDIYLYIYICTYMYKCIDMHLYTYTYIYIHIYDEIFRDRVYPFNIAIYHL